VSISDTGTTTSDTRRERELLRIINFHTVLLAMAAHDLRQPLQVIMGSYSSLARRHIDASEKKYVERGEIAVTQLKAQLDTLVEAIRLRERTVEVELVPVELQPFLAELCHDHAEAARLKGVAVHCVPSRAVVMSNRILLAGIMRNLIHNALKYTAPGGRVLLGCRCRGPQIRIEVHDTGVGIAPEQITRIFDAFQKFDATQAGGITSDGLGLGLFIVRHAAELVGHHVDVRSTVGRGSCFSIGAKTFIAGSGGREPAAPPTKSRGRRRRRTDPLISKAGYCGAHATSPLNRP
jgi:two-component system, OmpR family, phosphate regulon sensor histidine kinase PhoR